MKRPTQTWSSQLGGTFRAGLNYVYLSEFSKNYHEAGEFQGCLKILTQESLPGLQSLNNQIDSMNAGVTLSQALGLCTLWDTVSWHGKQLFHSGKRFENFAPFKGDEYSEHYTCHNFPQPNDEYKAMWKTLKTERMHRRELYDELIDATPAEQVDELLRQALLHTAGLRGPIVWYLGMQQNWLTAFKANNYFGTKSSEIFDDVNSAAFGLLDRFDDILVPRLRAAANQFCY